MNILKKILYFITISCFTGIFLISCNFLDFDESDRLYNRETVFSDFGQTTNLLNNLYSYLQQDYGVMGQGAMRACATDDAEYANPNNSVQDMNNGNWSALNVKDDVFATMYSGIRAANNFIINYNDSMYLDYKYDVAYPKWEDAFKYYKYEARSLRAYMYFELVKRYGDVPLYTNVLTIDEANKIGKTSFDKVINFIINECDAVVDFLPYSYLQTKNPETGRVTKGFVMALKSRVLLYAASPLHNESGDSKKWEKAAKASLALIDSARLKNWYKKELGASAVNNFNSKEIIFFRNNTNSSDFERYNFPVRFTAGNSSNTGICPTQNLVEAFETKNGYPATLTSTGWISSDPKFDPQAPYLNRDPRFYQTVLYNGAKFKGQTIETFMGGQDEGSVTSGGTATGYFLKKNTLEDVNFTPGSIVSKPHYWVIFRYGEILLNYAEAMIGAFKSPDYKDGVFTMSARDAINAVRTAATMPLITENNLENFITILRNERRVELAFEDHRFWDIRRWKIGASTQKEIYGAQIIITNDNTKYIKYKYETRAWTEKMNLYPINQQELYKNPNLEPQNSGW